MAVKTTLNATNLASLGADRLAQLLIEISAGDANAKRRLRLELIGQDSPSRLVSEVQKRIAAISAAETSVGWRTLKGFRGDLKSLHDLILRQIEPSTPKDALELLWKFLDLCNGVIERTNDASGEILTLFKTIPADIARLATDLSSDHATLIAPAAQALMANRYGQSDALVSGLAAQLGEIGLKALRAECLTAAKSPEKAHSPRPRKVSRWKRRQIQATQLHRRTRQEVTHMALEAIADAANDVDAFIDLQGDPKQPSTAFRIATRLHAVGRDVEALSVLDAARGQLHRTDLVWITLRIEILEASGHSDAAQSLRLQTFRHTLDPVYLRTYLKRLPDFEDVEAEDVELDAAITADDASGALWLLIHWPSLDRAARLVLARSKEISGENRERLGLAADRLAARYPAAASLLYRRMVEAILISALSVYYADGAGYVWEAERLAARIHDHEDIEPHALWVKRLREVYRHRQDFWQRVDS
ncbi:hypothetical protein PQU94_08595 [Asticcacaulis sp. DXS10W]|uniref:Uncharacterized protein n=1 Tax=Asticcacaulis currens TaxID=2984210 RepID=A0ABT5IDT2_9CAUL|nr:DUF6880 family protein [Asticcacaulis currens]MDC7694338.1 hypothetical protein [Asticcacaulis currens]